MRIMVVLGFALVMVTACKAPDAPPEYKYQSTKMDLPYTDWQEDQESAGKKAAREVNYYATDACHRMGYGWSLDKIENPGEMNCEETDEGYRCRTKQVAFVCRQLDDR
ncbi:MAG: hypothetical protein L0Y38_02505 [Methylococcaceae bacterium]|nr:hypothetical protein [Methylococcaceae bacterium]MCI0668166.1 hypothetical protein [Methylococcaceae bacterium]MCI0732678.1 hypothetical protein [Methylococcaceae bacterium]